MVTEKTEEEITNLSSSVSAVIGQAKVNGGESSKQRYPRRRVIQSHRRTYGNDKPASVQSDKIETENQSKVINDETKQKQENQAPKAQVRRGRPSVTESQSKVINDDAKQNQEIKYLKHRFEEVVLLKKVVMFGVIMDRDRIVKIYLEIQELINHQVLNHLVKVVL